MIFVVGVLLFVAIYFYTWRLADCMDKHAEYTNGLINGLAAQTAKASSDLVAVVERQTEAFQALEKALATHEHNVFETGRELSAAGRDLRLAMQVVARDLAERAH